MRLDRRTVLKGMLAGGALAAMPAWAQADPARPWTIPALREWSPREGVFRPGRRPRIVLAPREADGLISGAEVFAADLRALGIPADVIVRAGAPKPGDVALRLGAGDAEIGSEGYSLDVGSCAVVTANEPAGAFYGTRSLLQMLVRGAVPAGHARDWPRYAERGLMMDIGRKHFTPEWLAARIAELAYLKMNVLHLHFTEDLGWRIESDRDRRVHSDDEFLTKAQVADLVGLAAQHHIAVVGEIDLPGHMEAGLRNYPQFQLRDVFRRPNPGKLDYTIPEARDFVFELIDEFLPLFSSPYWHTGADEFLNPLEYHLYPQLEAYAKEQHGSEATVKDGIFGLVNQINERVKGRGKTLRVWNDGLEGGQAVHLDTDVVVEWWTDFSPLGDLTTPSPTELLDAGHRIHNAGWYPTYYTNLPTPLPARPDLEGMYETWALHRFRGPLYLNGDIATPYHEIDPAEPHNLGSKLHVWNDDPEKETQEQIAAGIHDRLRVMAQQTWESPKLVPTYAEFEQVISRIGDPPA